MRDPDLPDHHPLAIVAVKTVHTAIFLVELASIGWLVVSGLRGRRDRSVGLAAGAVAAEAAVFFANGRVCPLTPLAERYGAARGSVSDIFLPDAVARTIPVWSSALIGLAIVLHARAAIRPPVQRRSPSVTGSRRLPRRPRHGAGVTRRPARS